MTLTTPGYSYWYSTSSNNGTKSGCGEEDKDYQWVASSSSCQKTKRNDNGNYGFARAQAAVKIDGGNNTSKICYWTLSTTNSVCSGSVLSSSHLSKLSDDSNNKELKRWGTDANRSCLASSPTCKTATSTTVNVTNEGSQNYVCWYTMNSDGVISESFGCVGPIKVDGSRPSFTGVTKNSGCKLLQIRTFCKK